MHLIIANKIADRLSQLDRSSFLLGGIAPDAVSPKDLSHFYRGDVADYTRKIDYTKFIHKYRSLNQNHYILGYYSHLIADDIWLKGFYLPWLKNRMEADPTILHMYHNDFALLNGKLLEYYGLTDRLKEELKHSDMSIIGIDEVTVENVRHFIPAVLGDMEYSKEDIVKKLNVFTFDMIIGYIETSVDVGYQNSKKYIGN